jgi:tRNA A-37 threonylcarbamoyl transferase component Bud32
MYSNSTSNLLNVSDNDDKTIYSTHSSNQGNDSDYKRGRGLLGKFRRRDHRSKDDLGRLHSPPSPNWYMHEIPRHVSPAQKTPTPDPYETIDSRFRPVKPTSDKRIVIVTVNNETFTIINITDLNSVDQVKDRISSELNVLTWIGSTFHLTDFGCTHGEALDQDLLGEILFASKIDPVKLFVSIPPSTKPTRSPGQTSLDSGGNPPTPSYMILNNDAVENDDYFSTKRTASRDSVQASPPPPLPRNKPPPLPPNKPPPPPPPKFDVDKAAKNNNLNVPEAKPQEVRRKKSDDLSNTKRSPSPQPAPTSGTHLGTGANAGTAQSPPQPPPPPPIPSLQLGSMGSKPPPAPKTSTAPGPKSSDDSFKVIRPQKREINFDDRRSSPYDRRQVSGSENKTTNLVALRSAPPPPMGRQSSVKSRNFSGSSFSSTASHEKHKQLNVNTGGSSSESVQLNTYSPGQSENMIPKPYSSKSTKKTVIRKPVSSDNSPSTPDNNDENFKENDISFEGAPAFVDDDDSDSSDGGLWAKKPPSVSSKSSKPELRVETVHSSSQINQSDPSPSPMTKPDWAVRPTAEVVYDNLENFFPNTDLDKPIIADQPVSPAPADKKEGNGGFHPALSPVAEPKEEPRSLPKPETVNKQQKPQHDLNDHPASFDNDAPLTGGAAAIRSRSKMKSIRVVAREAKKRESTSSKNGGEVLRRRSTKVWGRQAVEVTLDNVNEQRKISFKQFMWVKGDLIGKGTFGKVYLALNVTTREMMAVKQVEVPQTASDKASSRQKEVIEALHSEVETMKDLDHLNIVQYLGFEALPDVYNLFLEYVPGGSVGRILQMYGRFEETLIKSLTRQVLDGLSYLHSCGILHRDLKADNLLLDTDGICKISDFGISKKSRNIYANDAEMSMQGTIFWMAPEVIHNVVHNEKQGYSAKVDVWSLGCVVLEMFAGRRPWSTDEAIGAMYKLGTSRQAPPIPDDTKPFVSNVGKAFLDKCFTINSEERPTARKLLEDEFCIVPQFNFAETPLGKMIRATCKKVHTSQPKVTNA